MRDKNICTQLFSVPLEFVPDDSGVVFCGFRLIEDDGLFVVAIVFQYVQELNGKFTLQWPF